MNIKLSSPPERDMPSLSAFPSIHKRVNEIIDLSENINISEKDALLLKKKLDTVIRIIRKCLNSDTGSAELVNILQGVLSDLKSKELVNAVYTFQPISLTKFERYPLVVQFVFLFANKRGENLPGAVCHHWSLFWYHFWKECRKDTPFEKSRVYFCQRTQNKPDIKYSYHSFLLLELGRFYIMTADGAKGITIREASNFSEVDGEILRTAKSGNTIGLEKIRTFAGPRKFAQVLEAIPDKEIQLALAIANGIEGEKV